MKHPTRSLTVESRSHLPSKPGQLCASDLFGPLPIGGRGVRYTLVCMDTFTKRTRLYALCTATTRSCLNRLNDYISNATKPECVLSGNGTQFSSPQWEKKLDKLNTDVKYSPVRHPESNPSECVIKERNKVLQNLL